MKLQREGLIIRCLKIYASSNTPRCHFPDVTARNCPRGDGAETDKDGCVVGSEQLREKAVAQKDARFRETTLTKDEQ